MKTKGFNCSEGRALPTFFNYQSPDINHCR